MAGEVTGAESKHQYKELDICYDPYFIENGDDKDNYLTFTLDLSETTETGRFNGTRLDFTGIDLKNAGFNEFDICFVGLFRTEEEADAFVEAYLETLGWENPDGPSIEVPGDETDAPVGGGDETDAPAGNETDAPAGNETDAPTAEETKAPAKEENKKDDAATTTDEGGCGSFVGFGAMAVVAVAAVAGMVSFKKKED